jgi:hypothetical protein
VCPTGYNGTGAAPSCVAPSGNALLQDVQFEKKSTPSVNTYTGTSSTVWTGVGNHNAKLRGQYLDGSASYIENATFRFSHTFTLTAWVRADDVTAAAVKTIFASTAYTTATNAATQNDMLVFGLNNGDGKLYLGIRKSDNSAISAKTSAASLSVKTWSLVGFSIQLKDDSETVNVNFRIGNGTVTDVVSDFGIGYFFRQYDAADRTPTHYIGTGVTN